MEIESKFAAVVASARGVARLPNTAGIERRACEVLVGAQCDLWDEGTAAGLSPSEVEAIANRYVEWDINSDPWPKPPDLPDGNVVAFRHDPSTRHEAGK
jgi:hypothetical protein